MGTGDGPASKTVQRSRPHLDSLLQETWSRHPSGHWARSRLRVAPKPRGAVKAQDRALATTAQHGGGRQRLTRQVTRPNAPGASVITDGHAGGVRRAAHRSVFRTGRSLSLPDMHASSPKRETGRLTKGGRGGLTARHDIDEVTRYVERPIKSWDLAADCVGWPPSFRQGGTP